MRGPNKDEDTASSATTCRSQLPSASTARFLMSAFPGHAMPSFEKGDGADPSYFNKDRKAPRRTRRVGPVGFRRRSVLCAQRSALPPGGVAAGAPVRAADGAEWSTRARAGTRSAFGGGKPTDHGPWRLTPVGRSQHEWPRGHPPAKRPVFRPTQLGPVRMHGNVEDGSTTGSTTSLYSNQPRWTIRPPRNGEARGVTRGPVLAVVRWKNGVPQPPTPPPPPPHPPLSAPSIRQARGARPEPGSGSADPSSKGCEPPGAETAIHIRPMSAFERAPHP